MKRSLLYFASLILFTSTAFAHDAKFHKGPMIEGKLLSVNGDKAEVQTKDQKVTLLLSSDTKIETGKEGNAATKGDLKVGSDIMAHGHKLDSGEFGATDILINPAAHSDHAPHGEGGDEKCGADSE